MRFRKRSNVEVFCKKGGPSGAWRCGEIVFSGNGHDYSVTYDSPSSKNNEDLVEKAAAILKVFSQNYYFVRLIGSSRELRIHKSNIRMRQLWEDGKWVVIGKGSGFREDVKSNKLSTFSCYQYISPRMPQAKAKTKVHAGNNCFTVENDAGFQDSCIATARTLKRASDVKECNGKVLKMRATQKKGEHQLAMPGCSSSFMQKVGVVAYPGECLGETYMYTSPYNQTIESYQMEREAPNYRVETFQARSFEANDYSNDECSVGSCSVISNSPSKLSCHILEGNSRDADSLSSGAESFYGRGDEEKNVPFP
ncbi:hypothetical protein GH714_039340 [Hevea brasiliensis]|uniref:Agenet-like domain-containing protein n=1 Tax=Hevea brasiliensis TaxID=3981 RepID=A0A6A6KFX5_HEVBR|nr:hypothetical protein GH714_039340 [Hevea brasiliensis]